MLSYTHKIVQKTLLSYLPYALCEYPFQSIKRIADIALLKEKIIFEVQCSQITLKELQKRTQDYESLGFSIIWILHHQTFNKILASSPERYLRKYYPTYFTSITSSEQGFFYDQLEFFNGMRRTYKGPPIIIKEFLPKRSEKPQKNFPIFLKEKKSCLYLPGDLTDQLIRNPGSDWVKKLEKKYTITFLKKFSALCWTFFHYLLYLNAKPQNFFEHKCVTTKNREKHLNTPQNKPPL